MRKFKSGDKVKLAERGLSTEASKYLQRGSTYAVNSYDFLGYLYLDDPVPYVQFQETDFELVEEESVNKLIDNQEHYKANGVEPIELMKQNFTKEEYSGFLQGNVLKYMMRFKRKNGLEDLKKALTYLTWLIEQEESK